MQKWIQRLIDRFLIDMRNEPSFNTGREKKMGGGNCIITTRLSLSVISGKEIPTTLAIQ